MRKVKEILRLKYDLGHSHRQIAAALGVSAGFVGEVSGKVKLTGLTWDEARELSEDELEDRLYERPAGREPDRPMPDFADVHRERLRPHVTLELLHIEYLEEHPNGYRYTQFCDHYRAWLRQHELVMRQDHKPGDKLFIDYSGDGASYQDLASGEPVKVELFLAVLGLSNYIFADVTLTQQVADFVGSHVRAFAFLGGVPSLLVPDQLRSAVTTSCTYEPVIQRTIEDLAQHYDTAVLPARPARPRDKAKVEAGVLIAQRWILARLRNQTFFSLAEVRARVLELVAELNDRQMRQYKASRRELFERFDRPALQPLPEHPYDLAEWKKTRVNIDYHVEFDAHFYSVPHRFVREPVDIRATATMIEILRRGERLVCHRRSEVRGGRTTLSEHMPASHRKHAEWTPDGLAAWGRQIGPATEQLVRAMLAGRPHPEMGYRSCLGLLRLSNKYEHVRLEKACERALAVSALSYRHVASMLQRGLDRVDPVPAKASEAPHENLRGKAYFAGEVTC